MLRGKSNSVIAAQLLLVMTLWGGNNVAVKYQIQYWPPVFTVSTRFLCAGLVLLALMRWTNWFGRPARLAAEQRRRLWTSGAVILAAYITIFVWAVSLTSPSTVALFMGASPVWALVWEERLSWRSAHRFAAAALALTGVAVLFLPSLNFHSNAWFGNLLGLGASFLWTAYSRQTRSFSAVLSGLELTGQTFWRAGLLLLPLALVEVAIRGVVWNGRVLALQMYGVFFSGLLAFALWSNALAVWPTSRAFLFSNLIPVTTLLFSHFCLGERITSRFWTALALIVAAVLLGQADGRKTLSSRWSPGE